MAKGKTRRGFTIVELVIVIGVIGILAAVLIPTFVNLSQKAQVASDQTFVKNANTALAMGKKHNTMHEAVEEVENNASLDIDGFTPASGRHLVWDSKADRFALVGDAGVSDVIYADGDGLTATENWELFHVYSELPAVQTFSVYAGSDWSFENVEVAGLTVGFDCGDNDIRTISYDRSLESTGRNVILATTNAPDVAITINAPHDTVTHFGEADSVNIIAVAPMSYHEHGRIEKPIQIASGRIVLESSSDAEAEVGAGAMCEVAPGSASTASYVGATSIDGTVNSLSYSGAIMKRQARVAHLDSVETIKTNTNPNRSSFYHNGSLVEAEHGVDSYKVGCYGAFKFPIYVNATVSFQERSYRNPAGLTWAASDGVNDYDAGTGDSPISYNNASGEMTFTTDAIGKTFTFTATYSGRQSTPFTFDVIDAYNAYDAKTLSAFDNRSVVDPDWDDWTIARPYVRHQVGNDVSYEYGEPVPVTGLYVKTAEVRENSNRGGIVLHDDIVIKNSDLPSTYFYSEAEVASYFDRNPTHFREWLAIANESRRANGIPELSEREGMKALIGSIKDDRALFYRKTALGENFAFEGNYFNIDASHLKLIRFFGNRHNANNAYDRDTLTDAHNIKDTSHATLFGWNAISSGAYQERGLGGLNTVKNVSLVLNGRRTNDDSYRGSLFAFKVSTTEVRFSNVNVSKCFTAFYSDVGYPPSSLETAGLEAPYTTMKLDRCKAFDSYNSLFYIYGSQANSVTNSVAKDAGGAAFILDERRKDLKYDIKSGNVDDLKPGPIEIGYGENDTNYWHGDPEVDCANVFFENYVTGTEPWFVDNGGPMAQTLLGILKGCSNGFLAGIDENQKSFTRIEADGSQSLNLIAFDLCPDWFTNATVTNPGIAGAGHFCVYDTVAEMEGGAVSDRTANLHMRAFSNPTLTPDEIREYVYSAGIFSQNLAVAFLSGNGGHGLPTNLAGTEGMALNIRDTVFGGASAEGLAAIRAGVISQIVTAGLASDAEAGAAVLDDIIAKDGIIPLPEGRDETAQETQLRLAYAQIYAAYVDTINSAAEGAMPGMSALWQNVATPRTALRRLVTADYVSSYINFGKGPRANEAYDRLTLGILLGMR
ncbi:MAG: type II secretion system GspH family protein [Bacilli bacterium]|nr:type II secretion system GspH family protein [Bacilli bacterium]